jgi:hypothetical protein
MKIERTTTLILAIALALYILIPWLSWADDRSARDRSECSAGSLLHGQGPSAAGYNVEWLLWFWSVQPRNLENSSTKVCHAGSPGTTS